ncbi:MAG TPA: hypothetical protein VFQ78_02440, partial [Candidatus Udaeobacter sp.]|nr:hypothetical protein [Candidatus Udaeobacter sp.]
DSSGNKTASIVGAVAGNSYALETSEPVFNQDLNGDGVIGLFAAPGTMMQISTPLSGASGQARIGAGGTLALGTADASSVTFAASTGKLTLSNPSTFSGEIFGFTGNGTLAGSDQIDLAGMNYNTVQDSYANGVLTVTDGTHTDTLNFSGSYSLANFKFASDGSGGTIVFDPPVPSGDSQGMTSLGAVAQAHTQQDMSAQDPLGIAADARLTGVGVLDDALQVSAQQDVAPQNSFRDAANTVQAGAALLGGSVSGPNVALLSSYIAGSFPDVGSEASAMPMIANTFQSASQSLLANPRVA